MIQRRYIQKKERGFIKKKVFRKISDTEGLAENTVSYLIVPEFINS